ncbi:hypothetical protein LBMAG42_01900 [Deltaproteobacteria bacterium]|nr:hypothetical protein LBMAG42_01900 [Deltaproteobacteria bacterium]
MPRAKPPELTRRAALGLGAAGLMIPRFGVADAVAGNNRRFLFVHCAGGWDTTYCFQPGFGSSVVDMEPDSVAAEVGGITFVDNEARPHVRSFFESYASRTAIVNGIEVPSITHERCRRIMMTGSAEGQTDDWGAILAGEATSRYLLPYFVLSGTAFTAKYSSRVVRVGQDGQLTNLLSGKALAQTDRPYAVPSDARTALVDQYVRARMGAAAPDSAIATAAAGALDDAESLNAYLGTLDIGTYTQGCYQMAYHMATVFDVFQLGLARTALIEYKGWCSEGWDTHSNNDRQGLHFEELFDLLALGIADLDSRTAVDGGSLADETVIVLFSEMGRTPQLNGGNGRDHWTYTSAMVFGAGVRGGQVIGGFDDSGYGDNADYATGEVSDSGTGIHARNFGASLLALGDVDPGEDAPITALLA